MSSKSRKRLRNVTHENIAECPFSVSTVAFKSHMGRDRTAKKRNCDDDEAGEAPEERQLVQIFPFELDDKLSNSMNQAYAIEPVGQWKSMTRYNSFILNGQRYCHDEFVYVTNETTKERQRKTNKTPRGAGLLRPEDYWVAKILEIRAADEHHVYARIYWMYWPDELPPNTLDGKRTLSGRQSYHGRNELVASNHMDVINILSVAMKATVHRWIESDDDEVQDALYWRQAFNCLTCQISSARLTCKCRTPANPDKRLIGCTNPDCGAWLHEECLLYNTLMRIYEQLGIDKPHKSEPAKPLGTDEGPVGLLPTPTESSVGKSPPSAMAVQRFSENRARTSPPRTIEDALEAGEQTRTPEPPYSVGQRSARSEVVRKRGRKKAAEHKPYEGLFEASLKLSEGPLHWVITDLRTGVEGGDRTWTEHAGCLFCNMTIE